MNAAVRFVETEYLSRPLFDLLEADTTDAAGPPRRLELGNSLVPSQAEARSPHLEPAGWRGHLETPPTSKMTARTVIRTWWQIGLRPNRRTFDMPFASNASQFLNVGSIKDTSSGAASCTKTRLETAGRRSVAEWILQRFPKARELQSDGT